MHWIESCSEQYNSTHLPVSSIQVHVLQPDEVQKSLAAGMTHKFHCLPIIGNGEWGDVSTPFKGQYGHEAGIGLISVELVQAVQSVNG